jgi:hypothetical protein
LECERVGGEEGMGLWGWGDEGETKGAGGGCCVRGGEEMGCWEPCEGA